MPVKVLFIIPPNVSFDSFMNPGFNERAVEKHGHRYGSVVTDFPMGILSLSAFIKAHAQVDIRVVDFNVILNKIERFEYGSFAMMFEAFLRSGTWANESPDIIGISALVTPGYQNMLDLGRVCRTLFPGAFLVAGGGVPTNMHREIFAGSDCFDALCYGEGERPMLELVLARDKAACCKAHPSWITRSKSDAGARFRHDHIEDLDQIPFLDFDVVDVADYRLSPIQSLFPFAPDKDTSLPVMTSRGCPHHCCFCSSHSVHGRAMRYLSVPRIREDFKRLKVKYGVRTVVFFDDHLMSNRKRFFEIVGIMKELGLNAFFPSSLALYALDRKVLEALRDTGVKHLVLSVESGSERVLKEVMHKPLDLSIVKRVIADCRDLGILADVSILIGLPGETKADIEQARLFLRTLEPSWFRISMATPLVGSEMFEICREKGYLKGDHLRCDFKNPIVGTEDFTPEYIRQKAYALNLELNFVHNGDLKRGDLVMALKGFENTIKVKDDHAFAYYFAAHCCKAMGKEKEYQTYKAKYTAIVEGSAFWQDQAKEFALAPLP
jgi:radical SAM superfamily enzyme YgiQ (UPF0313 family)